MKRILTLLAAIALLITIPACGGKLASGGVYADKQTLYVTDQTFESAQDTLDEVFKWEYDNRVALLQVLPELKGKLDKLRLEADAYIRQYSVARKAYLLTPSRDNENALDAVLNELTRLASAAATLKPANQ